MRLLAALAFLLLAAAPAHADPFGELPFAPLDGVAACVRPAGQAQFSRWLPSGAELLAAGPQGVAAQARVSLGRPASCPRLAVAASGAAVAAVLVERGEGYDVRVAVRDPGGAFAPAVTLAHTEDDREPAVAVSPRGDALVLLGEARGERERIVALRRPSGGSFAAEPLTEPGMAGLFDVAAGAGPGGELIAAWIEPSGVGTAVAPAGAPFGAAQRLGGDGDGLALAVAPDGRALVAWASAHDVLVSDRAPGGDRFGAPEAIPAPREFVDDIALAAGDGGRALVAWENGELDGKGPRVATRAPGGTFGAARTLTQPRIAGPGLGVSTLVERDSPLRPYDAQAPWFLRAAPAGDDFVLAWASDAYQELQAVTLAARVTDGGAEVAAVGASLRDNAGAVPLALPDGTAAVAWADQTFSADDKREQHARIHLALAGRPSGADPAPPEIAVSPRRQRVYRGDPIRFAVNCRAACDLLATIPISGEDAIGAHATAVAAGRAEIRSFIPRHARSPVHVTLRVSAPGGRRVAVHRVAVPVSFKPSVPLPRLLDVHAERDGDDLVVTWRTSFPARRVRFAVAAGETLVGVPGAGRRRFRARIRGEGGQKQFVIASTAPGRDVTTTTFKVR